LGACFLSADCAAAIAAEPIRRQAAIQATFIALLPARQRLVCWHVRLWPTPG
jgi:hypothetical protein